MIRTILFASDLGPYTSYLLHHVNALAGEHSARVVVLHAVEPPGQFGDAVVETYLSSESRRELEEQGIGRIIENIRGRILDVLEEEFFDGQQQGLSRIRDVRVLQGKPVDVILAEAGRVQADMIIMGSHGPDTCAPHMLGSVTARVLQLSRVPVYMVPLVRQIQPWAIAS